MTMIFRSTDERDEYIATLKARNEQLIIREANALQDRLDGVTTFNNTEDFLASLDDDIHTVEPPC